MIGAGSFAPPPAPIGFADAPRGLGPFERRAGHASECQRARDEATSAASAYGGESSSRISGFSSLSASVAWQRSHLFGTFLPSPLSMSLLWQRKQPPSS